ncbi:S-adenosyl-L-methionine-dependent methyltransferase [Aspergillus tetrazonus]
MHDFHRPSVIDDDASDASSVTIDHDPDRLYFLREASDTATREFIDLTEDETTHGGEYITDECFEILREDWLASACASSPPSPGLPEEQLLEEVCDADGIVYKPGNSVELHDGAFFRICSIRQALKGNVILTGRRLLKFKDHPDKYLPQWRNELIWVADEIAEIPLWFVRRFVSVHFSNVCPIGQDCQKNNNPDGLFCRLKRVIQKETTSIEYLTFEEADAEFRAPSASLRHGWRGETAPFGSKEEAETPVIVLDDDNDIQDTILKQKAQRKYTFGDGFCGAGGVSCGAEAAGLDIKWAFDLCPHAAATYRLNFPNVECEGSDIFSFMTSNEEFMRVDISHGSPPCQTFSPAHTIPGPNDDANSAAIFSCWDLIRKAKPRVHTMEETCGLFDRHQQVFLRVICDFIETGYSVRWALLNCMWYGVPQSRKRLIIIASGPGESLPRLPRPTHGLPGSGLRDLTTISQAIRDIPSGSPDHDVAAARGRGVHNRRAPFDGNRQARTITCGGGDNYHPSGLRGFTLREFACLQTFPLGFRFLGGRTQVKRQIGNAVPPLLAKAVFKEIIRSLQDTDEPAGLQNAVQPWRPRRAIGSDNTLDNRKRLNLFSAKTYNSGRSSN